MLRERLKEVDGGAVRHIDLWNHNVEFIEQEDGWERPAVFVEFCPIRWNAIVSGVEYRACGEIARCHGLVRLGVRRQPLPRGSTTGVRPAGQDS